MLLVRVRTRSRVHGRGRFLLRREFTARQCGGGIISGEYIWGAPARAGLNWSSMRLKKVVAAAGAAVAVLAGMAVSGTAVGSGSASADPGCPSLYVVAIPGTWETGDHKPDHMVGPGMLSGVTRGLPSSTDVDYVSYAAT